ncbi:MAG: signal peptidase II [Candidatus Woesearchaeota archaeon]
MVKRADKNHNIKNLTSFFLLTTLGFLMDRITKHLVFLKFPTGKSYPLIANLIFITPTRNSGAAFGIIPHSAGFLIIFSLFVLAVIAASSTFWINKSKLSLSLGLISAGILGNLYDRIFYSSVLDFLDLKAWPVFNLADSMISLGCFILILSVISEEVRTKTR